MRWPGTIAAFVLSACTLDVVAERDFCTRSRRASQTLRKASAATMVVCGACDGPHPTATCPAFKGQLRGRHRDDQRSPFKGPVHDSFKEQLRDSFKRWSGVVAWCRSTSGRRRSRT